MTTNNDKVITRGAGAGGANTNANGLPFEKNTELNHHFMILDEEQFGKGKNDKYEKFVINDKQYYCLSKRGLKNFLKEHYKKPSKSLEPDEVLVDKENKKIFIIEKKFQQCAGSVDEKLQTVDFKLWSYRRQYPEFEIYFTYVVNTWFKQPCYNDLMDYLKYKNIRVLWGEEKDYFESLAQWINEHY